MKTFIQSTEIWTPSRDRSVLEYHDGLYGEHKTFRLASEKMCFGYDQGLPGKAWAQRRPIVLTDLQQSYFLRRDAAREAGLTCGAAIPVFAGDFLLAVLVFYCGDDELRVGAIELWHNDPAQAPDMGLVDGYFGIAESFEWVSHHTRLMKGFGLPGLVWQSGMPEVMADLGHSNRFVRRDDARRVGINKGLGLPSFAIPGQHYVMGFLSALGTPIARRFEVWTPNQAGDALILRDGQCDRNPALREDYRFVALEHGAGLLGRVWDSGLPAVSEHIADEGSPIGESARRSGLDSMVAIPILEAGHCKAVVTMYF
ncbi:MAG: GAF domain-containing protein [Moraxellaceae bacterium]|nr:GAF domain-containing protein [Moraxellaceae bacterium]